MGFLDDKEPSRAGVDEIVAVIAILERQNIPCCVVAESALIYYGTGRMRNDWVLCVPTDKLTDAASVLGSYDSVYESFRPSVMRALEGMHHLYPRFKLRGIALFFVLTTAQECHIVCAPENFERSQNGIPYPKLSVYAQSLLDTNNLLDLDDLIDGMNLSVEWGLENLDLDGTFDMEWGRWKIDVLRNSGTSIVGLPLHLETPHSRRKTWEHAASSEQKKKRQGWKLLENHPTRFWHNGQKDPRLEKRDFC
ncbi:hypothetical protein N431DRAFT_337881 [Stipitochalara longipes BDJ]|nr:hypothetical protein N431DRAFT_337881 [Stipitochalara longipes BDJ]